jgi:hypothetical protein
MSKKQEFKNFVKENPSLIRHVKDNNMTWQKFYEIYDLYGSEHDTWNEYIKKEESIEESGNPETDASDLLGMFKNINLDSVQNGVNNLGRVVGLLGELTGKEGAAAKDTYKPRPLYKHFED